MKKTLKGLALALVMGLIVISLTGCGSDKLVATKTTQDEMMGNYKEEAVITFKNDKVETIEISMEFDNEEMTQGMYGLLSLGMSMDTEGELEGLKIEQKGKKIIMKMDAETYAKSEGVSDEEMTKEALKEALEKDGYTVK